MKFNEFIKKERKRLGFSQEALAEKLKISKSTIYNWETKGSIPNLTDSIVDDLANFFKCSKKIINLTILESVEDSQKIKYLRYNFLPNDIKNFELNENEVKLLRIQSLDRILSLESSNHKTTYVSKLTECLNAFEFPNENSLLETIKSLKIKCHLINGSILTNLISKYNLTTLNIQELQPEDILTILGTRLITYGDCEISLLKLFKVCQDKKIYATSLNQCSIFADIESLGIHTKNYFHQNSDYFRIFQEDTQLFEEKIKEVIKKFFTINDSSSNLKTYNNSFYLDEYNCYKVPYFYMDREYFMTYQEEDEEERESYNKEKEIYDEVYKEWNESMEKFKTLKEVYKFSENESELKEPTPPKQPILPTKYLMVKMTKKGEDLLNFINEYSSNKNDSIDDYIPSRMSLKAYLGKEICVSGFLAEIHEDKLLFKDIYKESEFISEHMWQYGDIVKSYPNLVTGNYYQLKGIVKTYKKTLKSDSKEDLTVTDYHIDISDISII